MRINNKRRAIGLLIKARVFNSRMPLAVRWQLTNRCILKCSYCNVWNDVKKELTLDEIYEMLDQMAELGTQTISFSGGEPMLRNDIFEILAKTKSKGISTEMNSTGAYIPDKIDKLKDLDFLKISLDGSEKVHNLMRGNGAYKIAIEAASAAKANNLNFIFTTTLTKFNLGEIGFLCSLAKDYGTMVAFQPVKNIYRGIKDISHLAPESDQFKDAVNELIKIKKRNGSCMRNSLIGLKHIYDWPQYKKINCWAGKIFCILDTDGTLMPCDRISYNSKLPNCTQLGFENAFSKLPDVHCSGCGFCGPLELNYLMTFKFNVFNSIKRILY